MTANLTWCFAANLMAAWTSETRLALMSQSGWVLSSVFSTPGISDFQTSSLGHEGVPAMILQAGVFGERPDLGVKFDGFHPFPFGL